MNSAYKNIVGPRVARLRREAGLNHEQMAALVASQGGTLDARDISRIERRERRVKDHEVLHLAQALGVAPDRLFVKRR